MLSIEVYERQLGHVDQLRNEWTRGKIADTLILVAIIMYIVFTMMNVIIGLRDQKCARRTEHR